MNFPLQIVIDNLLAIIANCRSAIGQEEYTYTVSLMTDIAYC